MPLTLAGTAGLQAYILSVYPDWSHWLAPTIMSLCLPVAAGLVVARLIPRLKASVYPLAAISTVGVLSLLIAPSIWAASAVWYGAETRAPIAGPEAGEARHEAREARHEAREARHGAGAASGGSDSRADPLLDYLQANQGDAKYLVAVTKATDASPIILNTNERVISLGGFGGYVSVIIYERVAVFISDGA